MDFSSEKYYHLAFFYISSKLGCCFRSLAEVSTEHYCQYSHQEKYYPNRFRSSKTYTRDKAAYGGLYLNTGIGPKPWFKFPGNRSIKAILLRFTLPLKALLNDYFTAWREIYWKLICSNSQSWLKAETRSLWQKKGRIFQIRKCKWNSSHSLYLSNLTSRIIVKGEKLVFLVLV